MNDFVRVVGAGLAGSEAALTLSDLGIKVELVDIKPKRLTPAHKSKNYGELVCSNSLKGNYIETSNGLLKKELEFYGCRLLEIAHKTKVDSGGALSVDREKFSQLVTKTLTENKNITIKCDEYFKIDTSICTIIASGPLTLDTLANNIASLIDEEYLYFYDAIAPIVEAETIDKDKAFFQSRYDKGGADYLNCPLSKDEYYAFVKELTNAKRAVLKDFEKNDVFEGCMPVEILASKGIDCLRFGTLKPVGLTDKDGKRPYAVLQLRAENEEKSAYNLVGFQTNLTFSEQKRVFSMIPALRNCEFLRYGVMHRNTFLNAPKVLAKNLSLKNYPNIFFAGQLSGVEGYVESIATGLIAGINAYNHLNGRDGVSLKSETMLGALLSSLLKDTINFQPIATNFGLLPPLEIVLKNKKERYLAYAKRALENLAPLI